MFTSIIVPFLLAGRWLVDIAGRIITHSNVRDFQFGTTLLTVHSFPVLKSVLLTSLVEERVRVYALLVCLLLLHSRMANKGPEAAASASASVGQTSR